MHERRKNLVGRLMRGNRVDPARQNYGNRTLGPWVFGLAIKQYASKGKKVRMFHVLRRDESTLRAIVLRHIRPGTEIWTDEWRAYTCQNRCTRDLLVYQMSILIGSGRALKKKKERSV